MTCDYELYQERIDALTARYRQLAAELTNTVAATRRAQLVEELELIDGGIDRLKTKAQSCGNPDSRWDSRKRLRSRVHSDEPVHPRVPSAAQHGRVTGTSL